MTTNPDARAQTGAHSHRSYPIVYRAPQPAPRLHLGRAVLLFGLPLVPGVLVGLPLALWVHPFIGGLAFAAFYVGGLLALGAVMHASLEGQQRERER